MDNTISARSDITTNKLLKDDHSGLINNQTRTNLELSNIFNKSEEDDREQNKVNDITEVEPNDFGYYNIKKQNTLTDFDFEFVNYDFLQGDKPLRFGNSNLIESFNYKKINEERKTIERVNLNKENLLSNLIYSKDNRSPVPDLNALRRYNYADKVQNTYNSFILNEQENKIKLGDNDISISINKEYQKRRELYEVDMLYALLKKYERYLKNDQKFINEPFNALKLESFSIRSEMKENRNPSKEALAAWKSKISILLTNFVKNYQKHNGYDTLNSLKWKNKVNELVNIWDLFNSNGMDLKFPPKYLILKKFLSQRAKARQENFEIATEREKENILANLFTSIIRQDADKPKSIILPSDTINLLIKFIVFIALVYNLFTIPLIQFLGYNDSNILDVDKYIDGVFFVEIILNFRTVIRDKYNNYVYDIHKICEAYFFGFLILDSVCTIPWHFFFIITKYYEKAKMVTSSLRVLRIFKLRVYFNNLDTMKINFLRILSLVFFYFLCVHWIGCFIYYIINDSLDFSNLIEYCYESFPNKSKDNLTFTCKYFIPVYTASYIIPGEYTSLLKANESLYNISEYLTIISLYIIGQVFSAYLFGGMTSTVQNLNQGENLYTDKNDLLNEHMRFYDISQDTMSDVKLYFEYLWQRQKDVVYGKEHFNLLNKSLRQKFEQMNLLGNELILAQFYNLTSSNNSKLIGMILKNLTKVILFPYEVLFEELSVTKGLYILLNGDIELSNKNYNFNLSTEQHTIDYGDIIKATEDINYKSNINLYKEKYSIMFPMLSTFIKTGRTLNRCFSKNFTDMLFLPLEVFEQLITNFPIEMHILKQKIISYVEQRQLFDNKELFASISKPSSRSISNYFCERYNKVNIWIPIPIPISQRKIALNYGESFVRKVRNLWKEINVLGDLNVCLESFTICRMFNKENEEEKKFDVIIGQEDNLENIRGYCKAINAITEKLIGDRMIFGGK
jgi:hypothetical protein